MSISNISKEERSALDSIEHELYNPKAVMGSSEIHETKRRKDLHLPTSWGDDSPVLTKAKEEGGFSFGAKMLLLATVLLLAALIFSAWRVISLRNVVSSSNIDMVVDIMPYVEGGESVPVTLILRNRNRVTLENVHVTLLYKQGTGAQDEQEKVQEKKELGALALLESKQQNFSLVLYGSEGEKRDVTLKLEYQVPGSNALFTKIKQSEVILRTPPISVSIDGPEKLSVGQNGDFVITVKNNSATTSKQSLLQVTMPNTFTLTETVPKPLSRTSLSWAIPPLLKGENKTITLSGNFNGKAGEVATFSSKIGAEGDTPSSIGVVYAGASRDVTLRSSPLSLLIDLTTESGSMSSLRYGDRAMLTLSYSNSSSQALEDVSIVLSLKGEAPLYDVINPINGYYDSEKRTITWDRTTFREFAVLPPNAKGTLQVVIPIIPKGTNSPTMTVTLNGTATTKERDDIVATVSKVYAIQGSASLEAFTQYKNSSLPNTGLIPPVPNRETTYTIRLRVSAQNTLSNANASFVLPAYVSWKNTFLQNTNVTYDTKTRTVTWGVGPLKEGEVRTAEIMVGVRPSQSHVGGSPSITGGIVLEAEEEVSKIRLKSTLSPLTTAVFNEMWPTNPSVVVSP